MLKIMDALLEVFAWTVGIFSHNLFVSRIKMRPVSCLQTAKKCVCFGLLWAAWLMVCRKRHCAVHG